MDDLIMMFILTELLKLISTNVRLENHAKIFKSVAFEVIKYLKKIMLLIKKNQST